MNLGTVAIIGISTKDAILQCHGYAPLLGWDDQSWGWNLVDNYLLHNGDAHGCYPLLTNAPKYQVILNYFMNNPKIKTYYFIKDWRENQSNLGL